MITNASSLLQSVISVKSTGFVQTKECIELHFAKKSNNDGKQSYRKSYTRQFEEWHGYYKI